MGTVLTISWASRDDLLMKKIIKLVSKYKYNKIEHWCNADNITVGVIKTISYIKISTGLGHCGLDINDFIEDCKDILKTAEGLRFIIQ